MGVGMPQSILLHEFGKRVWEAFGSPPYHVGTSVNNKIFRDVDVRLILIDEEYENWEFGNPSDFLSNSKWVSMCLAFSCLGRNITGLPIDFQIQQQTYANKHYNGVRSALGTIFIK